MSQVLVGLFGIFILVVGFLGNGIELICWTSQQKGFVAWLVVALVLMGLIQYQPTRTIGTSLAALIIVSYAVIHWPELSATLAKTGSKL